MEERIFQNCIQMEKLSNCKGRLKFVGGVLSYKNMHTCTDVGTCERIKALKDLLERVSQDKITPLFSIYNEEKAKFELLGLNIFFPEFKIIRDILNQHRFRYAKTVPVQQQTEPPSNIASSSPVVPWVAPPVSSNLKSARSRPVTPQLPSASPPVPSTPSPPPPPPPPQDQEEDDENDSSISVKWNTYATNMSTVIPNLLEDEKFVDVTLACDGKYIKCHKVILGACSPYFEELLSVNPCQHPIILMKDFQFWEIQAIVDFIYRGVVNIPQQKLPRLLEIATVLQIKGLTGSSGLVEEDDKQSVEDKISTAYTTPNKSASTSSNKHKASGISVKRKRSLDMANSGTASLPTESAKSPTKDSVNEPMKGHKRLKLILKNSTVSPSHSSQPSPLASSSDPDSHLSENISLHNTLTIKEEPLDFDTDDSALISCKDDQNMYEKIQDSSSASKQIEVLMLPNSINVKQEVDELYLEDSGGDPLGSLSDQSS